MTNDEAERRAIGFDFADEHEFEIWQDGVPVADVSSRNRDDAWRDALHYAAMYGQDGPVRIVEVLRRPLTLTVSAPASVRSDVGLGPGMNNNKDRAE